MHTIDSLFAYGLKLNYCTDISLACALRGLECRDKYKRAPNITNIQRITGASSANHWVFNTVPSNVPSPGCVIGVAVQRRHAKTCALQIPPHSTNTVYSKILYWIFCYLSIEVALRCAF